MAMNKKLDDGKKAYPQVNRSLSAPMSDAHREKLQRLRRQESMKGLLIRKFYERYGVPSDRLSNCGACSQNIIAKEVNQFLRTAVTERNLNRLERKIQKHAMKDEYADDQSTVSKYSVAPIGAKVLKPRCNSAAQTNGMSASHSASSRDDPYSTLLRSESAPVFGGYVEEEHDHLCKSKSKSHDMRGFNSLSSRDYKPAKSKQNGANLSKTTLGFSLPSEVSSSAGTPCATRSFADRRERPFSWAALDKHAKWEIDQEMVATKAKHLEQRDKLRRELDEQREETRRIKEKEREEEYKLYQRQMQDLQKAREEQERKDKARKELNMELSNGFTEQHRMLREREQEELRKTQEDQNVVIDRCEMELKQIRQEKHEKKMGALGDMNAFLADANVQLERSMEMRKAFDLEEIARIEKVKGNLLAQEQERAEEFNRRTERQRLLTGGPAGAHYAYLEAKKRAADERISREIEELKRRFDERENLKNSNLKMMRKDLQQYQLEQMESKRTRRRDETEKRTALQQFLTEDAEQYLQGERDKCSVVKTRNVEYQKALKKQIETKHSETREETNMTKSELEFNRRLVEKVESRGFS